MPDLYLDMGAARVLSSAGIPEYINAAGTTKPVGGYAFDGGTTVESIFFEFQITGYTSGNLTCVLQWYTAGTTGNLVMQASISAETGGTDTTSVLAKAQATATASTATAARTTANWPGTPLTITISNLDSLANGDYVTLRVFRDPTNGSDTLATDAIIT